MRWHLGLHPTSIPLHASDAAVVGPPLRGGRDMGSIATTRGDSGQTGLAGGIRVSKSSLRVDAYGTVDELNSTLGFARSICDDAEIVDLAQRIQTRAVQGRFCARHTAREPQAASTDRRRDGGAADGRGASPRSDRGHAVRLVGAGRAQRRGRLRHRADRMPPRRTRRRPARRIRRAGAADDLRVSESPVRSVVADRTQARTGRPASAARCAPKPARPATAGRGRGNA